MLVTLVRAVILYGLVVLIMRLMGKRQIGQLQPFELAVTIMIADLASVPMQDRELPLVNGIVPLLTLLFLQLGLSFLILRSQKARRVICGTPSVLIENGRLQQKEMARLRVNLNDLLEQLRAKNYANLEDVEFAVLETTGDLSIIPKSQCRPIKPADLKISTDYEGIPLDLIVDGRIEASNLAKAGLDEPWLVSQLKPFGFSKPEDIFFASLDSQGHLYLAPKE